MKHHLLGLLLVLILASCKSATSPESASKTIKLQILTPDGKGGKMPLVGALVNVYGKHVVDHDSLMGQLISDPNGDCSIDLDSGRYLIDPLPLVGNLRSWPTPPAGYYDTVVSGAHHFDTLVYGSPINAPSNLARFTRFDIYSTGISPLREASLSHPVVSHDDTIFVSSRPVRWRSTYDSAFELEFDSTFMDPSGNAQYHSGVTWERLRLIHREDSSFDVIIRYSASNKYSYGTKADNQQNPPGGSAVDITLTLGPITISPTAATPLSLTISRIDLDSKVRSFIRDDWNIEAAGGYSSAGTYRTLGSLASDAQITIRLY
jgi:hypothetical protein